MWGHSVDSPLLPSSFSLYKNRGRQAPTYCRRHSQPSPPPPLSALTATATLLRLSLNPHRHRFSQPPPPPPPTLLVVLLVLVGGRECGRNWCNYFNGNGSDVESDGISAANVCDFLKSLVVCGSVNERNVLVDTARIVEIKTRRVKGRMK